MRQINKVLNFFSTNYLNDTKYHHSTLGFLKIFFERNNKHKSSVASLGNVFKNSKWSDFKTQNIKTSLIKNWATLALFTVLVSLVYLGFFGNSDTIYILIRLPFIGELIEVLYYFLLQIEDTVQAVLVLGASVLNALYYYFNKSQVLLNPKLPSDIHRNAAVVRGQGVTPLLASSPLRTSTLTTASTLYKTSRTLRCIPSSSDSATVKHFTDFNTLTKATPLANNNTLSTAMLVSSIDYTYTSSFRESNDALLSFSPTLNETTKPELRYSTLVSALNTSNLLELAKQDRWVTKNTILSDNLTSNSNAFTQAKKLIGVNLLNNSSTSRNVWSSAKLSTLGDTSDMKFLSGLQANFAFNYENTDSLLKSSMFNTNLSKFDNFEASRMFLTKKFFFTGQLKNNVALLDQQFLAQILPAEANSVVNPGHVWTSAINQELQFNLNSLCIGLSNKSGLQSNTTYSTKQLAAALDATNYDLLKTMNLVFLNEVTSSNTGTYQNLLYFSPCSLRSVTKVNFTDLVK